MDTNRLTTDIESLINKGSNDTSEISKLESVFDDVEKALKSGVKRDDIYKALVESGLNMSKPYFFLSLHRIRKKRKSVEHHSNKKQSMKTDSSNTLVLRQKEETKKDSSIRQAPSSKSDSFNFNPEANKNDLV